MRPRLHGFFLMLFTYGLVLLGVPGFFCLGLSSLTGNKTLITSFILLILFFISYYLIIRRLPVHCSEPNCLGRMNITISRDSLIEWKVKYQCESCDHVYEQYIYYNGNSNAEF
jgi:hypothetical protein